MITVHHLEHSRSQRILWLLEELGLPYQIVQYPRDPKTHLAPPALRAIHPLGKSPVIQDGDVVVAESAAIVEYLIDQAGGRLRPAPGTQAARDYTYWTHCAEGSVMPFLVMTRVFDTIENAPVPWFAKPLVLPIAKGISRQVKKTYIGPSLQSQLDYIESWLSERTWFCGETVSGADIMMSFPLEAASVRALQGNRYPAIARYVEQMRAQPAYQRALEKGGPLQLG